MIQLKLNLAVGDIEKTTYHRDFTVLNEAPDNLALFDNLIAALTNILMRRGRDQLWARVVCAAFGHGWLDSTDQLFKMRRWKFDRRVERMLYRRFYRSAKSVAEDNDE